MIKFKIPLTKPFFNKEEEKEIVKVLKSKWVSQGPTTLSFENKFKLLSNSKFAVAVNSATSGLHLSLLSLKIKKGNDILVSDFTFPASGNSILYTGARPIPIDVDLNTFNITTEQILQHITKKTKAIMPIYGLGNPPQMDEIVKIAKENNLFIIEDSACAHGSYFKNKMAGTFGDIGVFSFHARKIITTGEGGMIITNNKNIYKDLILLRSHGMNYGSFQRIRLRKFIIPQFNTLGYNYRISDITSAIGISQIKKLNKIVSDRRKKAKIYSDLIKDHSLPLFTQKELKFAKHNYQTYAVRTRSKKIRDNLIFKLRTKGIETTIGTYSLSNLSLFKGKNPISNILFNTTIALPMFYGLKEEEIKTIITEINDILN